MYYALGEKKNPNKSEYLQMRFVLRGRSAYTTKTAHWSVVCFVAVVVVVFANVVKFSTTSEVKARICSFVIAIWHSQFFAGTRLARLKTPFIGIQNGNPDVTSAIPRTLPNS